MVEATTGNEAQRTPRWRWWVTILGLIPQALAGATYVVGLNAWASSDGGGFLGTSESVGMTTVPTLLLLIGGVVALYATAVVGLGRTRSWVTPAIGIAGATLAGGAATWMISTDYPGQGLAAIGFGIGLYIVWLASVATVLGFLFTLVLGKRKR